jgi:hypothetical protein
MAPAMTFEEVIGEASTGDAAVATEVATPTETAVAEGTATEVVPAEETASEVIAPLSEDERGELARLEDEIISAHRDHRISTWFQRVGDALTRIKERQLYRESGSWEVYVRSKWQFSPQHAHHLTSAAEVIPILVDAGLPSPESEGAVRGLVTVPADRRVEVWQGAVEASNGRKVTGRHVAEVKAELGIGKPRTPRTVKPADTTMVNPADAASSKPADAATTAAEFTPTYPNIDDDFVIATGDGKRGRN